MAKFYVGQRVRVVRPVHPQNMGLTASVSHIGPFKLGQFTADGFRVPQDCDLAILCDGSCKPSCAQLWQIEPIQPSGAVPSEYSFTELMDKCREGIAA